MLTCFPILLLAFGAFVCFIFVVVKYRNFESNTLFFLGLLYLLTGLLQFSALFDLFSSYGLSRLTAFCLATVVGYSPFVGSALGAFAVLRLWHFSGLKTVLVFLPAGLLMAFIFFVLFVSKFASRKRR